MIAPPSRHHETARRLLEQEIAIDPSGGPVPAAERLLRRSFEHLAAWFGFDSIHALVSRSLAHARRGHPPLSHAHIEFDGELRIHGVAALEGAGDSVEVRAALAALIASLFSLLERLIGEDMVARLLHQIWPGQVRADMRTRAPADNIIRREDTP